MMNYYYELNIIVNPKTFFINFNKHPNLPSLKSLSLNLLFFIYGLSNMIVINYTKNQLNRIYF
jgi:hypothetical protein